jgi:hypothetical protein
VERGSYPICGHREETGVLSSSGTHYLDTGSKQVCCLVRVDTTRYLKPPSGYISLYIKKIKGNFSNNERRERKEERREEERNEKERNNQDTSCITLFQVLVILTTNKQA